MKKDKKKPQKESILAQSLQMPEELLKGDSIISLTRGLRTTKES